MKIKHLLRETGLGITNRNKHDIFFCHFFYRLLGLKHKYSTYSEHFGTAEGRHTLCYVLQQMPMFGAQGLDHDKDKTQFEKLNEQILY